MLKLELDVGAFQTFSNLVLDYTGTLAEGGTLISGVAERLIALAGKLEIIVLTANTFGTAQDQLAGLPLAQRDINTGQDKLDAIMAMGCERVIAIGNGRNDIPMLKAAGLAIAVIGPEGAAAGLIAAADIVVHHINDALDLLLYPLRLKATLRE